MAGIDISNTASRTQKEVKPFLQQQYTKLPFPMDFDFVVSIRLCNLYNYELKRSARGIDVSAKNPK